MQIDALTVVDWIIICIVGISALVSLMRGFVREAFSLGGWVVGFVIAMLFADRAADVLVGVIADPGAREVIAFALLLVLSLVASTLLSKLVTSLVESAGLSLLDRILGMGFGAVRGLFIILALMVTLRPALGLDRYLWWQQSQLLPHLVLMENWFHQAMALVRQAIYSLFA